MSQRDFSPSLDAARTATAAPSRAPLRGTVAEGIVRTLTVAVLCVLVFLIGKIVQEGAPALSWEFLSQPPREANTAGGIWPAIFGTFFVVVFMILLALPLGVFGAVYLTEYAGNNAVSRFVRAGVTNLAGVPSIVFGLFGLGFFVVFVGQNLDYRLFDTPRSAAEYQQMQSELSATLQERRSAAAAQAAEDARRQGLAPQAAEAFVRERTEAVLAEPSRRRLFGQGAMFWAAATLAILVLPVIIVSTEEALRAVPANLREAAYGLGATKWQMIAKVVLPQAAPGILTGAILAVSRGAGELAPVLFVGVASFKPDLPLTEPVNFGLFELPVVNPFEPFMHLNYHIYTLATQSPNPELTRGLQFGTTLVLLGVTLLLNVAAILLRRKFSRGPRA